MIISAKTDIRLSYADDCPGGIVKVAHKVVRDIRLICGDAGSDAADQYDSSITIAFGVNSDADAIAGKREVYSFTVKDDTITIVGSDKRGCIYGLFRISDIIGVSPLVDWSGLLPPHRDEIVIEDETYISKEPSVRYRGFFINDEWPAFGTWCTEHFGGFNAKMYEHVFELLLRMKGNYLWPAMWSACFACDGPGLEAAELADEYGVVMGTSHHEPCLRHGEEYRHLRGEGSIYGDAWDFRSNKEGITRFWADGLARNGHLENVITVGMRGERDSAILGDGSGLADNIALLKDVLHTQNELIRKYVGDPADVPRMLALYKEVEPYYYGDDKTEGLIGCDELDGVILLLCDDNHGYLRRLPDDRMRAMNNGFGMYYHFDYHGEPVSYEWINSSALPTVWEQMTTAYTYGVKDLWIVNVGDLALNEMPLCYFMDLAYDMDKWGAIPDTEVYLRRWMSTFALDEKDTADLARMYDDFTHLLHKRRPEHLDETAWDIHNGEAREALDRIDHILSVLDAIEPKIPEENSAAFYELISYPVRAGTDLVRMWIDTAYNRYYASIGAVCANRYGDRIRQALITDKERIRELHTVGGGRFSGFGLAPHIGFKHWNCEESAAPVISTVIPVDGKAVMVGLITGNDATAGLEWTGHPLEIREFCYKDGKRYAGFFTALCGTDPVAYTVDCDNSSISIDKTEGILSPGRDLIEHIITFVPDKSTIS
ncbi:MAG: glycosyl hydrolase 115 family protein [Oscillospiraceae bacterium]|nr:glycosyl hydrolase 115 family protein [Oscillospiraceae bacterium]